MIRVKDFMKMYNVSKCTIYNWMNQGLKSYKINKIRMFNIEEIEEFIKNKNRKG